MMRRLPGSSLWVLGMTTIHLMAVGLELAPALRLPTALLFYFTCPGALIADWVELPQWPARLALVIGNSLASNITIVTFLLTASAYTAARGLAIVSTLSIALALYTAIARRRPEVLAIGRHLESQW